MSFKVAYTDDGGLNIVVRPFVVKDAEVLSKGQVLKLDITTGEVEGGTTADTTFAGIAQNAVDNTDDGLEVEVVWNPGAIFEITDANARVAGEKLDLAAGGLGLAAAANNDFVVVWDSAATEKTAVAFNGTHYMKR